MDFLLFGFGAVVLLWITCSLGPVFFARSVKEWRGTKKGLLWSLLWGLALAPMMIVYVVALRIIRQFTDSAVYATAFGLVVPYILLVCIPYWLVKTPIKKKYGIIEDSDIENMERKQARLEWQENLRNRTAGERSPSPTRQYLAEASKDAVPPKPKKSLSEIAAEAEAERGNNSTTNPWDKYNSE